MIEINLKAKRPDPWGGPFLESYEEYLAARAAGKYVCMFTSEEGGSYEEYDVLSPARQYPGDSLAKFFVPGARRRLKAHSWKTVVVYKIVLLKRAAPFRATWHFIYAKNLEEGKKLEAQFDNIIPLGALNSMWLWAHTGDFSEEVVI